MKRSAVGAKIKALPRHTAFVVGLCMGIAALVAGLILAPGYAIAIGANAMFATYLILVALVVPHLTTEFLAQRPDDTDMPVAVIFAVTVLAVFVAVGSLFIALNDGGAADPLEIGLSIVSVLLGWFTVHTMAGLHYAHEYYRDDPARAESAILGGLEFPGTEQPDGAAFLYFSYVIGMTAQVADVAVSSRLMRRRVTIHGLFSFFFNTVIVAAAVNVIVTIAGG